MRIDARDAPDAPRTNSVLLHWEISLCSALGGCPISVSHFSEHRIATGKKCFVYALALMFFHTK